MLTEELPSAMNYAEQHAKDGPDRDAGPTVAVLEEILETAKNALAGERYTDIGMDVRRPPSPRPRP
jgi:hypothetical protein